MYCFNLKLKKNLFLIIFKKNCFMETSVKNKIFKNLLLPVSKIFCIKNLNKNNMYTPNKFV